MTKSSIRDEIFHVARYIIFLVLIAASFVAINIQTVVVDIPNLAATKNGYPKIAILLTAFKSVLGTVQPVHIIAAIALIWLYYHTVLSKNARFYLSALLTGGIFSVCLLIGMSFSKFEDFSFITESKYQMVIALTVLLGYWGIFYSGICALISWLDRVKLSEPNLSKFANWIDKHLFAICLIVILLCWLPYCIVYAPGSLPHDAQNQLNQFYGISNFSNHHPVTGTLIMGAIVRLGDFILNKDFGVALYMAFQSIVCALVFSSICVYLRKKRMPLAFSLGCMLFYAIVPTWGAYAECVLKDTLYYAVFAWFVLEYIKCFLNDGGKYGIFKLSIASAMVCLLRNEGFYMVFLALVVLLIIVKVNRKGVCIVLAVSLLTGIGINHIVVDYLGISSSADSTRESMTIPFMQIARYVRDCGDDLTEEEIQVIDAILDYEHLAENYNAELSDNVKSTYRTKATDEDWKAFWQLWAEKLIERPVVFADAVINQCYGYFDPFYFYNGSLGYHIYIKGKITSNEEEPIYAEYIFSPGLRNAFDQYMYMWQKTPILSLLLNCATYTWLGILLLALALRKKDWRGSMIFLIPALNVLICCVSPVNGYLRYMLPILASMPLYIYIGLRMYLFPIKEGTSDKPAKV